MGYTHYFYTKPELKANQFKDFATKVKTFLDTEEAHEVIRWECDQTNKPVEITNELVRFNGIGNEGHETFYFSRKGEVRDWMKKEEGRKPMAFAFCKTAQKPYDKYVTASLIVAKMVFDNDVRISSDGDISDWVEGKELVEKALNGVVTMTVAKDGDGEDDGFNATFVSNVATESEIKKVFGEPVTA